MKTDLDLSSHYICSKKKRNHDVVIECEFKKHVIEGLDYLGYLVVIKSK